MPNPSELLEDFAFESLIQKMRGEYDYILIDTPPIVSVSDALIVAKYCNGVILVVESKLVSYKVLQLSLIHICMESTNSGETEAVENGQ